MMVQSDLVVTALTLLGGGAVGAALGGAFGGVVRWGGGRLHVFIIGCMAAGAGLGFTYGGPSSIPGYVDAAEAQAMDLGLPFGGSEGGVLRVLRAYYPGDYARAVAAMKAAEPDRRRAALNGALAPVIAREIPMADTDNALALLKLAHRRQAALMTNPSRCYRAMRGARSQLADSADSDALQGESMRVVARFLTQTALAPQVKAAQPDVADRLRRIAAAALSDLPPTERAALRTFPHNPTVAQASAACDLGVKVYEAMLLAPDSEAAEMFKGLRATGFQRAAYR